MDTNWLRNSGITRWGIEEILSKGDIDLKIHLM